MSTFVLKVGTGESSNLRSLRNLDHWDSRMLRNYFHAMVTGVDWQRFLKRVTNLESGGRTRRVQAGTGQDTGLDCKWLIH